MDWPEILPTDSMTPVDAKENNSGLITAQTETKEGNEDGDRRLKCTTMHPDSLPTEVPVVAEDRLGNNSSSEKIDNNVVEGKLESCADSVGDASSVQNEDDQLNLLYEQISNPTISKSSDSQVQNSNILDVDYTNLENKSEPSADKEELQLDSVVIDTKVLTSNADEYDKIDVPVLVSDESVTSKENLEESQECNDTQISEFSANVDSVECKANLESQECNNTQCGSSVNEENTSSSVCTQLSVDELTQGMTDDVGSPAISNVFNNLCLYQNKVIDDSISVSKNGDNEFTCTNKPCQITMSQENVNDECDSTENIIELGDLESKPVCDLKTAEREETIKMDTVSENEDNSDFIENVLYETESNLRSSEAGNVCRNGSESVKLENKTPLSSIREDLKACNSPKDNLSDEAQYCITEKLNSVSDIVKCPEHSVTKNIINIKREDFVNPVSSYNDNFECKLNEVVDIEADTNVPSVDDDIDTTLELNLESLKLKGLPLDSPDNSSNISLSKLEYNDNITFESLDFKKRSDDLQVHCDDNSEQCSDVNSGSKEDQSLEAPISMCSDVNNDMVAKDDSGPVVEESSDTVAKDSSDPVAEDPPDPIVKESSEPDFEKSADPVDEISNPIVKESLDPVVKEVLNSIDDCSDPVVKENSDLFVGESSNLVGGSSDVVVDISDPVVEEILEPVLKEVSEPVVEKNSEPVVEEISEPVVEEISEAVGKESSDSIVKEISDSVIDISNPVVQDVAENVPLIVPSDDEDKEEIMCSGITSGESVNEKASGVQNNSMNVVTNKLTETTDVLTENVAEPAMNTNGEDEIENNKESDKAAFTDFDERFSNDGGRCERQITEIISIDVDSCNKSDSGLVISVSDDECVEASETCGSVPHSSDSKSVNDSDDAKELGCQVSSHVPFNIKPNTALENSEIVEDFRLTGSNRPMDSKTSDSEKSNDVQCVLDYSNKRNNYSEPITPRCMGNTGQASSSRNLYPTIPKPVSKQVVTNDSLPPLQQVVFPFIRNKIEANNEISEAVKFFFQQGGAANMDKFFAQRNFQNVPVNPFTNMKVDNRKLSTDSDSSSLSDSGKLFKAASRECQPGMTSSKDTVREALPIAFIPEHLIDNSGRKLPPLLPKIPMTFLISDVRNIPSNNLVTEPKPVAGARDVVSGDATMGTTTTTTSSASTISTTNVCSSSNLGSDGQTPSSTIVQPQQPVPQKKPRQRRPRKMQQPFPTSHLPMYRTFGIPPPEQFMLNHNHNLMNQQMLLNSQDQRAHAAFINQPRSNNVGRSHVKQSVSTINDTAKSTCTNTDDGVGAEIGDVSDRIAQNVDNNSRQTIDSNATTAMSHDSILHNLLVSKDKQPDRAGVLNSSVSSSKVMDSGPQNNNIITTFRIPSTLTIIPQTVRDGQQKAAEANVPPKSLELNNDVVEDSVVSRLKKLGTVIELEKVENEQPKSVSCIPSTSSSLMSPLLPPPPPLTPIFMTKSIPISSNLSTNKSDANVTAKCVKMLDNYTNSGNVPPITIPKPKSRRKRTPSALNKKCNDLVRSLVNVDLTRDVPALKLIDPNYKLPPVIVSPSTSVSSTPTTANTNTTKSTSAVVTSASVTPLPPPIMILSSSTNLNATTTTITTSSISSKPNCRTVSSKPDINTVIDQLTHNLTQAAHQQPQKSETKQQATETSTPELVLQEPKFIFQIDSTQVLNLSNGHKMFKCDICDGVYYKTVSLKKHYIKTHINSKYLSESDQLGCGIKQLPSDQPQPPKRITKIFIGDLSGWVNTTMPGLYHCFTCHAGFDQKSELKAHLFEHPPVSLMKMKEGKLETFMCSGCSKTFAKKQLFVQHRKICDQKSAGLLLNQHCLYCDKSFLALGARNKHHFKMHHPKRKFQPCMVCKSKKAKDVSTLFKHMCLQHKDKYFGCLKCKIRFLTRTELLAHNKETHDVQINTENKQSEEKPPEENVVKMQCINEGNGKFRCGVCNKTFNCELNVSRHHRLAHGIHPRKKIQTAAKKSSDSKDTKEDNQNMELNAPEPCDDSEEKRPSPASTPAKAPSTPVLDPETQFYSRIAINIRENLLHHLDGKLDSQEVLEFDLNALTAHASKNKLNFSDSFTSLRGSLDSDESSTDSKHNSNPVSPKVAWEKFNFPKNYDGRCGLTSYIKDMSHLDISTQLTMRRNLQRLNSVDETNAPPDVMADVPSGLSLVGLSNTNESTRDDKSSTLQDEVVELSGEWTRPRSYVCAVCYLSTNNLWDLEEHKIALHPNVWCPHHEVLAENASCWELVYNRTFLEPSGVLGSHYSPIPTDDVMNAGSSCTKCSKQYQGSAELHRHMLDCGGDTTWMTTMFAVSSPGSRRNRKWRPFGSRRRRQQGRRGLKRNIPNTPVKQPGMRIRTKPGDTDSIQKMIANLPPKRITRRIIGDDGEIKTRSQGTLNSVSATTTIINTPQKQRASLVKFVKKPDGTRLAVKSPIMTGKSPKEIKNVAEDTKLLKKPDKLKFESHETKNVNEKPEAKLLKKSYKLKIVENQVLQNVVQEKQETKLLRKQKKETQEFSNAVGESSKNKVLSLKKPLKKTSSPSKKKMEISNEVKTEGEQKYDQIKDQSTEATNIESFSNTDVIKCNSDILKRLDEKLGAVDDAVNVNSKMDNCKEVNIIVLATRKLENTNVVKSENNNEPVRPTTRQSDKNLNKVNDNIVSNKSTKIRNKIVVSQVKQDICIKTEIVESKSVDINEALILSSGKVSQNSLTKIEGESKRQQSPKKSKGKKEVDKVVKESPKNMIVVEGGSMMCNGCGMQFDNASACQRHMKTCVYWKEEMKVEKVDGCDKDVTTCRLCNKTFPYLMALINHQCISTEDDRMMPELIREEPFQPSAPVELTKDIPVLSPEKDQTSSVGECQTKLVDATTQAETSIKLQKTISAKRIVSSIESIVDTINEVSKESYTLDKFKWTDGVIHSLPVDNLIEDVKTEVDLSNVSTFDNSVNKAGTSNMNELIVKEVTIVSQVIQQNCETDSIGISKEITLVKTKSKFVETKPIISDNSVTTLNQEELNCSSKVTQKTGGMKRKCAFLGTRKAKRKRKCLLSKSKKKRSTALEILLRENKLMSESRKPVKTVEKRRNNSPVEFTKHLRKRKKVGDDSDSNIDKDAEGKMEETTDSLCADPETVENKDDDNQIVISDDLETENKSTVDDNAFIKLEVKEEVRDNLDKTCISTKSEIEYSNKEEDSNKSGNNDIVSLDLPEKNTLATKGQPKSPKKLKPVTDESLIITGSRRKTNAINRWDLNRPSCSNGRVYCEPCNKEVKEHGMAKHEQSLLHIKNIDLKIHFDNLFPDAYKFGTNCSLCSWNFPTPFTCYKHYLQKHENVLHSKIMVQMSGTTSEDELQKTNELKNKSEVTAVNSGDNISNLSQEESLCLKSGDAQEFVPLENPTSQSNNDSQLETEKEIKVENAVEDNLLPDLTLSNKLKPQEVSELNNIQTQKEVQKCNLFVYCDVCNKGIMTDKLDKHKDGLVHNRNMNSKYEFDLSFPGDKKNFFPIFCEKCIYHFTSPFLCYRHFQIKHIDLFKQVVADTKAKIAATENENGVQKEQEPLKNELNCLSTLSEDVPVTNVVKANETSVMAPTHLYCQICTKKVKTDLVTKHVKTSLHKQNSRLWVQSSNTAGDCKWCCVVKGNQFLCNIHCITETPKSAPIKKKRKQKKSVDESDADSDNEKLIHLVQQGRVNKKRRKLNLMKLKGQLQSKFSDRPVSEKSIEIRTDVSTNVSSDRLLKKRRKRFAFSQIRNRWEVSVVDPGLAAKSESVDNILNIEPKTEITSSSVSDVTNLSNCDEKIGSNTVGTNSSSVMSTVIMSSGSSTISDISSSDKDKASTSSVAESEYLCLLCKKHFNSPISLVRHQSSPSHKANERNVIRDLVPNVTPKLKDVSSSVSTASSSAVHHVTENSGNEQEWTETTSMANSENRAQISHAQQQDWTHEWLIGGSNSVPQWDANSSGITPQLWDNSENNLMAAVGCSSSLGSILDSVNKILADDGDVSLLPQYSLSELQTAMGASDEEMAMLQQLGEKSLQDDFLYDGSNSVCSLSEQWSMSGSTSGSAVGDDNTTTLMDLDNQQPAPPLTSQASQQMSELCDDSTSQPNSSALSDNTSGSSTSINIKTESSDTCDTMEKGNTRGRMGRPRRLIIDYESREMVCPSCCKHFLGLSALQQHVTWSQCSALTSGTRSHAWLKRRALLNQTDDGDRRLVCYICKEIFNCSSSLDTHVSSQHSSITKADQGQSSSSQTTEPSDGAEKLKIKMSNALGGLLDRALNNLLCTKGSGGLGLSGQQGGPDLSSGTLQILSKLCAVRRKSLEASGLTKGMRSDKVSLTLASELHQIMSRGKNKPDAANATATPSSSVDHVSSDQDQRPYSCPICQDRFLLSSTRNRHMAQAHTKYGRITAGDQETTSQDCAANIKADSEFLEQDWRDLPGPSYDSDEESETSRPPTSCCSDCGLSFAGCRELTKHRKEFHPPLTTKEQMDLPVSENIVDSTSGEEKLRGRGRTKSTAKQRFVEQVGSSKQSVRSRRRQNPDTATKSDNIDVCESEVNSFDSTVGVVKTEENDKAIDIQDPDDELETSDSTSRRRLRSSIAVDSKCNTNRRSKRMPRRGARLPFIFDKLAAEDVRVKAEAALRELNLVKKRKTSVKFTKPSPSGTFTNAFDALSSVNFARAKFSMAANKQSASNNNPLNAVNTESLPQSSADINASGKNTDVYDFNDDESCTNRKVALPYSQTQRDDKSQDSTEKWVFFKEELHLPLDS